MAKLGPVFFVLRAYLPWGSPETVLLDSAKNFDWNRYFCIIKCLLERPSCHLFRIHLHVRQQKFESLQRRKARSTIISIVYLLACKFYSLYSIRMPLWVCDGCCWLLRTVLIVRMYALICFFRIRWTNVLANFILDLLHLFDLCTRRLSLQDHLLAGQLLCCGSSLAESRHHHLIEFSIWISSWVFFWNGIYESMLKQGKITVPWLLALFFFSEGFYTCT